MQRRMTVGLGVTTALLALGIGAVSHGLHSDVRQEAGPGPGTLESRVQLVERWVPPEPSEEIGSMHEVHVERFIEAEGFGLSRIVRFEPFSVEKKTIAIGERTFRVASLDLIGLVKHETPVLYKNPSPHGGPLMRDISKYKAVALSAVEDSAIKTLRADAKRAVTITGHEDKPVIVGALRSGPFCQGCHEVEDGTLLGAFRYRLEEPVE